MIKRYGVVFLLVLNFIQVLFSNMVADEGQWLVWDSMLLLNATVISYLYYTKVSFTSLKEKLLSLLLYVTLSWATLDFIILTLIEDWKYFDVIRNVSAITYLCLFVPVSLKILWQNYIIKSDTYQKTGTFLAFNLPRNLLSLLQSIIMAPYGYCSLIVDDQRFLFKRGKVIQRQHKHSSHFYYKKIEDVPLHEAKELRGINWSLKNNCFSLFYKFKDYAGKSREK